MREWRKDHALNVGHRKRDIARSTAGVGLRRGKIDPRPCQICGNEDAEMHHPDHELPLVIVWLCREHHLAWHAHWRDVARETFSAWIAVEKPKPEPKLIEGTAEVVSDD